MKTKLEQLISQALQKAHAVGDLPLKTFPVIEIEEPQVEAHGDFATNIALVMAASQKMPPRKIAQAIIGHLDDAEQILAKTEIAGPGFINFFVRCETWYPFLRQVHAKDLHYGASNVGQGAKIQVEFVSSNPTGPLHVGHGRGAAVGDSVGNILAFCGYTVEKEYYINDSGRQIHTLGLSIFLRYLELMGKSVEFHDDCYQGEYIREIAQQIKAEKGADLAADERENAVSFCARYAARIILKGIEQDLASFGVRFEKWFSEQSLYDSGEVARVIKTFQTQKMIYAKDDALWFKTSAFGDEKDRVVVRKNGQTTYFASDIAYHIDKYGRGFDRVIDVWGSDHHGYIPRMTAAVEASGRRPDQFKVILVQLVNLLRKGEPIPMSTRAGEFVTLKEVVDEVGRDAARFIFLTRHYESPLDFDLELAKQKTNDNPVYYVQYVHARIAGILRKGKESGIAAATGDTSELQHLNAPEEIQLIKNMVRFPEVVRNSALTLEPHRITFYLVNLASAFHTYYNKHRVLTPDRELTRGRLYLIMAVQKIMRNGLSLLGVGAPERM